MKLNSNRYSHYMIMELYENIHTAVQPLYGDD